MSDVKRGQTMKILGANLKVPAVVGAMLLLALVVTYVSFAQAPAAAPKSPAPAAKPAAASAEAPSFMFVQTAEDLKVDSAAKTFRLVNVSQQTIYFSDRPYRMAGHLKMADYLKEWTSADGKDNLGAVNPNATISVYEPGQPDNSVAIVEISKPKVEGKDLVYCYKIIEGKLPGGGGATCLFIDRVGVGGGVGAGYHGAGVGRRGPGVR
jgi:hypothetical protein